MTMVGMRDIMMHGLRTFQSKTTWKGISNPQSHHVNYYYPLPAPYLPTWAMAALSSASIAGTTTYWNLMMSKGERIFLLFIAKFQSSRQSQLRDECLSGKVRNWVHKTHTGASRHSSLSTCQCLHSILQTWAHLILKWLLRWLHL